MTSKAGFALRHRNPDVLTCIANLSNDEVFTPPSFANRILDSIADAWAADHGGADLWANRNVKFLDPATKSGVFLREITSRLVNGLAKEIPNLSDRVEHILTTQVFGVATTSLTSMLARRSVYCSKHASGTHSIASRFASDQGNIWFERGLHTWRGSACSYCGASRSILDRGEALESHAYDFIHTSNVKARIAELFGDGMQFDVIVGNPPYQLSTDGFGVQARPIYQMFVDQAKALQPRLLAMVIPARWFSGGMGLDDFRAAMLNDRRIRVIEDYPDSNEVFPGTQIKGGICYFVWKRDDPGDVSVTTHDKGLSGETVSRPLLEPGADVFIRYNEALPVLRKIASVENGESGRSLLLPEAKRFSRLVSAIGAFGLDSTFRGKPSRSPGDIKVYRNGGVGYLPRSEQTKEMHAVDAWKVFIPRAGSGSDSFPHSILGKPFIGEPGSISSWTYMYIGPFGSRSEAENVATYVSTRLFRFLVLLHKPSQDATRSVYTFVPVQDFSRPWTDDALYAKYGIDADEIGFIEKMVRPMDLGGTPARA